MDYQDDGSPMLSIAELLLIDPSPLVMRFWRPRRRGPPGGGSRAALRGQIAICDFWACRCRSRLGGWIPLTGRDFGAGARSLLGLWMGVEASQEEFGVVSVVGSWS